VNLCLSQDPACCGLAPCGPCHHEIVTRVIPKAMIAGGFNGSQGQAHAFFTAYARAWEELIANRRTSFVPPPPETLNGGAGEVQGEWVGGEQNEQETWEEAKVKGREKNGIQEANRVSQESAAAASETMVEGTTRAKFKRPNGKITRKTRKAISQDAGSTNTSEEKPAEVASATDEPVKEDAHG